MNVLGEQAASVTGGLGFINVIKQRCVGEECVSFCGTLTHAFAASLFHASTTWAL